MGEPVDAQGTLYVSTGWTAPGEVARVQGVRLPFAVKYGATPAAAVAVYVEIGLIANVDVWGPDPIPGRRGLA